MKQQVTTIYHAKTHLSKLVQRVQQGDVIYIGAYGIPQAILAPIPDKAPVKLGIWEGKHAITYRDEDLIGPDPKLIKQFEESTVMPGGSY